jgi:NADH:ubiquinone oxidoreductase subunit 5 (subunit L)/multisubunit Na+/H+ antiporter MnhA subunit
LYGAWLDNQAYLVFVGNWVEVGNHVLVDFVLIGDLLSLMLLIIMAFGSVAVVSFVYVEMWEDKEGPNFVILLVAFLAFMGVLAAGGNVMIFYLG